MPLFLGMVYLDHDGLPEHDRKQASSQVSSLSFVLTPLIAWKCDCKGDDNNIDGVADILLLLCSFVCVCTNSTGSLRD
jgi:hypothetical protein